MSHRRWLPIALALGATAPGIGTSAAHQEPPAHMNAALAMKMVTGAPSETALVFVHGTDVRTAETAARDAGLRLVDSFDRVGVAVAAGPLPSIASMQYRRGIRYLESADTPVEYNLETSHIATRGNEVVDGTALGAFDGSGVSIAVIDTGIDATHPMFQIPEGTKVVKNLRLACVPHEAFNVGSQCPKDHDAGGNPWVDMPDTDLIDGHGTHVAAIAAGVPVTEAGRALRGAAPGARVVGLGTGAYLGLYGPMAAMDWVLENHAAPCGLGVAPSACPPIRVVNNSWFIVEHYAHDPDGVAERLQELLLAEGITVVWSAGNYGGDGIESKTNGVAGTPSPGAIMVAAYDDAGQGRRDWGIGWYSSRGHAGHPETYPDVAAPGKAITSACRAHFLTCLPPNGYPARENLDYATLEGTSMAAPHVAGLVALLLQADPSLTPAAIEDVLEDTARQIVFGAEYEPDSRNADHTTSFDKGHGLVDAVSALASVLSREAPAPPARCTAHGAVAEDNFGDANGIAISGPAPSDATLDLAATRLDWDAGKGALTFALGVADLEPDGASFDVSFTFRGSRYFIEASRARSGTERFALGRLTAVEREIITDGLRGVFDTTADRITVALTQQEVVESAELDPLANGDVLSEFIVASRRSIDRGAVAPLADSVHGACPYTIGLGAVAPQGGLPEPTPDGALSAQSPIYSWDGESLTNNQSVFGCEGISHHLGLTGRYPSGCDRELIEVIPPAGGATLDIEIRADKTPVDRPVNALISDLDLFLFGPDGSMLDAHGVAGGDERVTKRVTEAGVYTITVLGYQSANAIYAGEARLLL